MPDDNNNLWAAYGAERSILNRNRLIEAYLWLVEKVVAGKYIQPSEVLSPAKRWSLITVLFDPKKEHDCPLALGRWDNRPVLAIRWNGDKENPIGNPQSRGLPTWFVLPERYYEAVIEDLPQEMQTLARNFFPNLRK